MNSTSYCTVEWFRIGVETIPRALIPRNLPGPVLVFTFQKLSRNFTKFGTHGTPSHPTSLGWLVLGCIDTDCSEESPLGKRLPCGNADGAQAASRRPRATLPQEKYEYVPL